MIQAWQVVNERPGSAGYLSVSTRTYLLPDGTRADWDIFGGERSVAVVALTANHDVVLARQFRPGPGAVLDEIPGGYVEPREDPLAAAARELLEETGYAGDLSLCGSSWLASACRTRRYVAVTTNARKVADPEPQAGEFCEVVLKPLAAFRAHLRSGELTDVDLGYLALEHLGLLADLS